MLNLRTRYGINLDFFKEKYNFDLFNEKEKEIQKLIKNNLMKIENNNLIATYEGSMILDQLFFWLI